MSQNNFIHCSKYRPLLKVFLIQVLLLNLLILTDLSTIKAQRAINNAELRNLIQHHPQYQNVQNSNLQHQQYNANDNTNDEHNDLELYDEPLFFEESEFNEHNVDNVDSEHQSQPPFKNVIHATQYDSFGLTIIPTAVRPEQQNYQTIYLPAILPIHKRKLSENNKTESCSSEINSPAIYDLESILWTLDQINQLIAYKNGMIFNLAVLDSCSSPTILEKRITTLFNLNSGNTTSKSNKSFSNIDLLNTLPSFNSQNIIGFITSLPSSEFLVAHTLLSQLNITLISAQDISFLPNKLGFQHRVLQTALPIEYFVTAALQHLKQQHKNIFSVIYSNESLSSITMLDDLVKWSTVENSKDNQLIISKDGKEKKKSKQQNSAFCIESILNTPSNLNTGEASKHLIQLQNEIKNNNINNIKTSSESLVLVLTESHTTRELLVAYQHLMNAGILGNFSFILLKESNLNIVTGIESSMLNTLVIRESQKSLRDFVEYFEQLKGDNNLRNPFFKKYWQQSVSCGLNRDCLFDQIEPINTINSIQSTYALANSIITTKNQFCANKNKKLQKVSCELFNESNGGSSEKMEKSKNINILKDVLLSQLMTNQLDLHHLSKHFNHAMKFSEHTAFPDKSVDVLKFRIVNQAYRFDRIANYLNSGLIREEENLKDRSFGSADRTPSLTSLAVNHQLLTCSYNSPYHSSLTRTDMINSLSTSRKSKNNYNWSQSWWRCWHSIVGISSLVGALVSVVCAIYFLFTFDYKVGSTILGYMILIGIFLLYVVNFFFLYPYNFMMCWVREYLMSISYTIILASMLVKVMNHWRLNTYHNYNNLYIQHLNLVNSGNNGFNNINNFNNFNQNTNIFLNKKLNSITTLMSMCLGLVSLESLTNLIWLTIYPPRPQQIVIDGVQHWKCYNIQMAVLIETDSIFSVLFTALLILITMFFSCLTWKHSAINSYESRWIMFSSYVMLITWIVWAFLFKMFHLIELRDLFIVIANLLVSTSILICMFIRKLIIFYRLNKAKKYSNKNYNLTTSPSISSASSYNGSYSNSYNESVGSSYYGSVGAPSVDRTKSMENTSNKKINKQLKNTAKQSAKQMAKANKTSKNNNHHLNLNSTQMSQDNLDNVSTISAITTTSSIISSVKSYFSSKNKHEHEQSEQNIDSDFHLTSIATVDQTQSSSIHPNNLQNQQQEFYPMDVYDVYESGRSNQQNTNSGSQQPDSLFYATKKNIFNSNHSLYLIEEKDYM